MTERTLPGWARQLTDLYESDAVSQFILFGNVNDRFIRPGSADALGTLSDFLCQALPSQETSGTLWPLMPQPRACRPVYRARAAMLHEAQQHMP